MDRTSPDTLRDCSLGSPCLFVVFCGRPGTAPDDSRRRRRACCVPTSSPAAAAVRHGSPHLRDRSRAPRVAIRPAPAARPGLGPTARRRAGRRRRYQTVSGGRAALEPCERVACSTRPRGQPSLASISRIAWAARGSRSTNTTWPAPREAPRTRVTAARERSRQRAPASSSCNEFNRSLDWVRRWSQTCRMMGKAACVRAIRHR